MDIQEMLAREAIRCTLALYNSGGDRGDYDELGRAFAEDGVIVVSGGRILLEGRTAIVEGMRRRAQARGLGTRQDIFQRHHLTTSRVDFASPTEASGRTYFMVLTELGPDHCGVYTDRFVQAGEQWLIAHRHIGIDWMRPDSRHRASAQSG